MKRKVMLLMTVILLMSSGVFAQGDVFIDLNGNLEAGATNPTGRLEVQGDTNRDGIVGVTGGTGKAIYGTNGDPDGHAGYFEGNAEITGNLNVQGAISGENDPKVGTLINGKWCTTNGSQINCMSDAPSGGSVDWSSITNRPSGLDNGDDVGLISESDPTVGTLTNGKWCTTNGSQVICTSDAPGGGGGAGVCDQSCVDGFNTRIAALEQIILTHFSRTGNDIYITGANLHVESGSGSTDGAVNGLGNVIIGYNETIGAGSHNLVVGKSHDYASYGGIVAGLRNEISGAYSSVIGGEDNIASGLKSSILGGNWNITTGELSSVTGGNFNEANGTNSSVNGGGHNKSNGSNTSINGGYANDVNASSFYSTINGGQNNVIAGDVASINGGQTNYASGSFSSVNGGKSNTASGRHSSVSGGQSNIASGDYSVVP